MSLSCSDLLCGEDSNIIFAAGVDELPEYSSDIDSGPPDVEESIAGLLEDERDLAGINWPLSHESIDASTRADSVAWILKVFSSFQTPFHWSSLPCAGGEPVVRGAKINRWSILERDETVA